tara:strand:+ start:327 stop:1439 length:1113 start_codon:yes stop_codon:yes gene_type:complete
MNEKERLLDLLSYNILDTPSERELDDITEIACELCDSPISLITLLDEKRQWFKSKKGLNMDQTSREDSFCQHTLSNSNEVLIVEDSHSNAKYSKSPLVTGEPKIRFYAGAPLVTPNGNVLGTLCVIDDKPKKITNSQKNAIALLGRKVMDFLNSKKTINQQKASIELNAKKLKRLTDQVPMVIYQAEMTKEGILSFQFVSEGLSQFDTGLDTAKVIKNPECVFEIVHPCDLEMVKDSIMKSFNHLTEWNLEYRVLTQGGEVAWHYGRAKPERKADGGVVWYGAIQNITKRIEYEHTMEQISFDISHVLRSPVTTLLGLTAVIESEAMDEEKLKEYSKYIKTVSTELDKFTRNLNDTYYTKMMKIRNSAVA